MGFLDRFRHEPTQQEVEEQAVHDKLTDENFELI
jgi:hypothetical protein